MSEEIEKCGAGTAWLKEFMKNRQVLDTGEHGAANKDKGGGSKKYDSASEELADRAKTYMRENKEKDYETAQKAVLESDPDLAERNKME